MDGTLFKGYDPVAPFRIKADRVVALRIAADGDLHLVAVFELMLAFDGERNGIIDPRDLAQRVAHRFGLHL